MQTQDAGRITRTMSASPEQPVFTVDQNRLTLLDDGERRLGGLLALIDGAAQSLRLLFYIYADDKSGEKVNAALLAAHRRGVAVSLIVDGFGSDDASDNHFFAPLRAAGIEVCRFSPRFSRRYLLRNHQKLALADAETDRRRVIVGGFNVADDYFGTAAEQAWRDLGLLVEGPVAERIAGYYDALFDWIRNGGDRVRALNRTLAQWSEREGALRWLIGGPTRRLSPWARAARADMRHARRIDMVAGYFTPSPAILRRIDKASKLGGAVRIVTASKSDNDATIAAARFTYRGMLKKGVRIFEYLPTKLHTKLYVIDDAVHIGSANFDMRSLFINLELMLRIEDRAFADHVRGYIDGEIAQSQEITAELHRQRTGILQRAKQFAAYVMVGIVDPTVSRGLNFGV